MKTTLLLCALLLGTLCSQAQYKKNIVRTENVFKINFLTPGVSYEHATNKNQTIHGEAYIALALRQSTIYGSNTSSPEIDIAAIPAFNLQYRLYYNYEKRKEADKRTEKNSMNYIAPAITHVSTNNKFFLSSVTSFGFLWGMQRNYSSHFSLDLNLGLGYAFLGNKYDGYSQGGTITGMGDLRLGFWLNNKKN